MENFEDIVKRARQRLRAEKFKEIENAVYLIRASSPSPYAGFCCEFDISEEQAIALILQFIDIGTRAPENPEEYELI